MQNSKNIHLFFGKEKKLFLKSIDAEAFKRRYVGNNISIHISSSKQEDDFFDEEIFINIDYFQKICFSPVLGEEVAINQLANKLYAQTLERHSHCFNLFGHPICNALVHSFSVEVCVGFQSTSQATCNDNILNLLRLYRKSDQAHGIISSSLIQKSLKQFDQERFKRTFSSTVDHKQVSPRNSLKKIIINNKVTSNSDVDAMIISDVRKYFTVLDDSLFMELDLIPDAIISNDSSEGIDISTLDSEETMGRISLSIASSLNNWFVKNIFIDYLGLTKTSFGIERLISTYPKEMLQEYLLFQVSQLKELVNCLLASERLYQPETAQSAIDSFSKQNTPLGLTLLIHLSQNTDQNQSPRLETLKNRLRTLNSLYERIFRLCSIEMPKNDLVLTL